MRIEKDVTREELREHQKPSRYGAYHKTEDGWVRVGDGDIINQGGRIPHHAILAMNTR